MNVSSVHGGVPRVAPPAIDQTPLPKPPRRIEDLPIASRPPKYWLQPDVAERRLANGRVAEYEAGTPDPAVAAAGPPSYFRTYDQMKSALFNLQDKYPDLIKIEDIGDSYEKSKGGADRDIFAVRLSNHSEKTEKPNVFYLAGEHAREIANPELMMRFITKAAEGYGTDPEMTALLNSREINIVPMMNPDGHALVEQGYAKKDRGMLWHRKNTSPPAGTDLNRNYDYKWGGSGASSNPRSDTYRGAAPASEPEVQAIQNFVLKTKPAAMIDWHSYSRLNLYPWGYTKDKAPDDAGLRAMAEKFSTMNHYTPKQSIGLYPTNGTSKDWVYGATGAPAFTIETGDTFHAPDKEYEESWALNSPIMSYVAKVADNPYQKVRSPDVVDVMVHKRPDGLREVVAQTAHHMFEKTAIVGAELVANPNVAPGKGLPLIARDGSFNGANELGSAILPKSFQPKDRMVYVRAQDANGNWGPLTAQWLDPNNKPPLNRQLEIPFESVEAKKAAQ